MPGRLFLETSVAEVARYIDADASAMTEEPARRNIAPGQTIIVCRSDRRLVHMRWGMIPVGRVNARGRPVMETIVNARSETVFSKSAFSGVKRCAVPCDGWYEWTGKPRAKTAWRIRSADGKPLVFAAISDAWQAPGGAEVHQVATVTCAPSADVADIHDRMGVLLEPDDLEVWLTGTEAEAGALARPWPEGRLTVEKAIDVDWSAP